LGQGERPTRQPHEQHGVERRLRHRRDRQVGAKAAARRTQYLAVDPHGVAAAGEIQARHAPGIDGIVAKARQVDARHRIADDRQRLRVVAVQGQARDQEVFRAWRIEEGRGQRSAGVEGRAGDRRAGHRKGKQVGEAAAALRPRKSVAEEGIQAAGPVRHGGQREAAFNHLRLRLRRAREDG